ncbi:MAG: hypothetical protein QW567_04175 [Candidatus Hadarchaeales archaeon]
MTDLPAKDILYIIVIGGSLAFGIQAMFLGIGGRTMVAYGRNRGTMLLKALVLGLCIGTLSIITTDLLGMGSPYIALWLVAYTVISGAVLRVFPYRAPPREIDLPQANSDDLKRLVRRKGLNGLIEEKGEE